MRFIPVLATALLAASLAPAQTPIPALDHTRIAGVWYEIARIPNKREKTCTTDAFELIAPSDKLNALQLVDSCKTRAGFNNVRNAIARPQDKKNNNGDGRLKITTLWPLTRKYWFFAVDPDYQWTLVGSPDHKALWIYSKTPTLAPETLSTIKSQATTAGFNASSLVPSPQTIPQPASGK